MRSPQIKFPRFSPTFYRHEIRRRERRSSDRLVTATWDFSSFSVLTTRTAREWSALGLSLFFPHGEELLTPEKNQDESILTLSLRAAVLNHERRYFLDTLRDTRAYFWNDSILQWYCTNISHYDSRHLYSIYRDFYL